MQCRALVLSFLPLALAAPSLAQTERFEKSVRPVLANQCVSCHGATQQLGGIRLDRGISAEQAKRLVAAIGYDGPVKMPPSGKLPDRERAALTEWASVRREVPPRPNNGE